MANEFPYVLEEVFVEDWPRRWTRTSTPTKPRRPKIVAVVCANCDARFQPTTRAATPFCTPRCRAEADAVRYGRRSYAEHGNQLPDDIAYALRIKRAFAISGGYPASARRLTSKRRAEVVARDDGCCVLCGESGEDIDHINGNSDELSNLRLLCKPCHRQVTEVHLVPIDDVDKMARALALEVRTCPVEPIRPCDGPDWTQRWRSWMHEHATYEVSPHGRAH